jgi:hypothetical protein
MNLRSRIEQLEQADPGVVWLVLDDGTRREFPGMKPLSFLAQAEQEFRTGSGRAFDAVMRAASASANIGRMHELMRSTWIPQIEAQGHGIATPTRPGEAAPIKVFNVSNSDLCPN